MNTLAPTTPALYATVTHAHTGDIGLVRSQPLIFPGITTVHVEWDHTHEYGITEVNIDDLLTEYRTCTHGADASGRCGMDCAPGHDLCERHGGASPITIEVTRG